MNKVFILSMLLAAVAAQEDPSDFPSDMPSDVPSMGAPTDVTGPTESSAFAARALVAAAVMAVGAMFA